MFVEPEGLYTNEMYLGGMSSSLPEDVQYAMYGRFRDWKISKLFEMHMQLSMIASIRDS